MYIFRSTSGDTCWYFKDEKEYLLGRRNTDILINDKSLSKTHAKISLKDSNLFLTDLNSTYGTIVNGKKVEPEQEISLSPGDVIKFGILQSVFKVEKMDLVTTATKLSEKQKSDLKTILGHLKGKFVANWSDNCTHVTATEFSLTVKILHAILDGKKIVTFNFWKQFVKNINQNLPPPNEIDFMPSRTALIENYSLEFKPERKTILRNKVFIFCDRKVWKQLCDIISKTGGESVLWQDKPVSVNVFKQAKKQYLLISNDLNKDKQLNELLKHIRSIGQRTIALDEIGMAIVTCSCEKNCNPYYFSDSKSNINLALSTQESILAFDTQNQNKFIETQDSVEVGPSFEPDIIDLDMLEDKKEREFKRPLDKDFESQAKKARTDKIEATTEAQSKKNSLKRLLVDDDDDVVVQPKPKTSKKEATKINVFAPKDDQIASTSKQIPNLTTDKNVSKINPFSSTKTPEKRVEQAKIINPFFKVAKNAPLSTSKKPSPQKTFENRKNIVISDDEEENEIKYSQQMLENLPSASVIFEKGIDSFNTTTATSTTMNKSRISDKWRKKSLETDLSKINWLNKEKALKELELKRERGELEAVDPKLLEISQRIVEIVPRKAIIQDSDYEDLIKRINDSSIGGNSSKVKPAIGGKTLKNKLT